MSNTKLDDTIGAIRDLVTLLGTPEASALFDNLEKGLRDIQAGAEAKAASIFADQGLSGFAALAAEAERTSALKLALVEETRVAVEALVAADNEIEAVPAGVVPGIVSMWFFDNVLDPFFDPLHVSCLVPLAGLHPTDLRAMLARKREEFATAVIANLCSKYELELPRWLNNEDTVLEE